MKVAINQALCQGDCICAVICPQVFLLDETGLAFVAQDGVALETGGIETFAEVPLELVDDVRDAVQQCPMGCILSEDNADPG